MPAHSAAPWVAGIWVAVLAGSVGTIGVAIGGPVTAAVAAVLALQAAVILAVGPRVERAVHTVARRTSRATRRTIIGARAAARIAVLRLLPVAVGSLVLLIAVDWGAGALWQRISSGEEAVRPALELAQAQLPPPRDPRADGEAYADSPWVDRYFSELEAVPFTYLPFVGPREAPVHGRYINTADGIRRSYEPAGADDARTVWFFGGSTLWGEGQRDLHTIPSEVARLAERDRVTLRVVNYGIRGYTAFQEFLVFEQELARRDPPDLAVFYHGANESYSLLEAPANLGSQPSIYQIDTYAEAFDRAPPLPQERPPGEPTVARDYVETSLLHKLLRATQAAVETPAGAQEGRYRPTIEQIDRALAEAAQIYRRSVALIGHTARQHDVPTLDFWQPAGEAPADTFTRDDYADLGDRVADVSIDISDALADPPSPIYIDGLHTNELGARLSAEAIWRHLAPEVDAGMDR